MVDDLAEPMAYKWALRGMVAGFIFIALFAYQAGVSLWAVLLFFCTYFLMAIGLTKVRAGLGPPLHETIGERSREHNGRCTRYPDNRSAEFTVLSFFSG